MRSHLGAEYRRFARNADKILHLPKCARVLEIGPGPGWAGIELCKLRGDITLVAVEASSDMIRASKKNAESEGVADRTEYKLGVVEDLSGIESGSFDAVISRDSLHHWTDPSRAFAEIKRVLNDTGGVYVTDSKRNLGLAERLVVRAVCKRIGKDMSKGWTESIGASWTPAEIRAILAEREIRDWSVHPTFLDLEIGKRTECQPK
ncbi:MAG TPA: class I SAM-dependent methyltransferase [Treponemataceae bacterium]|nr:class I SAM-dependent methyltransferase [Treponemataceae bacterium]